jgi:hypothetical protein
MHLSSLKDPVTSCKSLLLLSLAERNDHCSLLQEHSQPRTSPIIAMDLADIQDWIKIRRERITAPDHLSAIDALAMCLNGSEPPNAVAAIITKAYSTYVEQPLKNSDSDRVQGFWVMLCDAARMFESAQSRLIGLLHELSRQPDIYTTDGSLAKTPSGMVYWRDLPGLPFALCDDALC